MQTKIILTEKKMDFLLGNPSVQNRTISALSPSAQYTTLCAQRSDRDLSTERLLHSIRRIISSNPKIYAIAWLLLTFGLRISEVLSIKRSHIRTGKKIYIPGKKKSDSRYVCYSGIEQIIDKLGCNNSEIFIGISRWHVYRELKKLGIILTVKGNKNKSVCHAGRHLVALELKQSGDSTEAIKHFYSHKSIKSTQCYTHE